MGTLFDTILWRFLIITDCLFLVKTLTEQSINLFRIIFEHFKWMSKSLSLELLYLNRLLDLILCWILKSYFIVWFYLFFAFFVLSAQNSDFFKSGLNRTWRTFNFRHARLLRFYGLLSCILSSRSTTWTSFDSDV